MGLKPFHVGLSAAQAKVLEKLAAKLGLDKSNAIRYCISRIAEQEHILADRSKETGGRG
jgi:antitoxin component of RelBE/YafQ-DinJ toxin-antitoxin module